MTDITDTYEKLLNYAFFLLSKKRYTTFELKRKLLLFLEKKGAAVCLKSDLGSDAAPVNQVLARLQELKYLDDKQYALDHCRMREKMSPRGKFLLKQELAKKGVNKQIIEEVVCTENVDELELALSALNKKKRLWTSLDPLKKKDKAFRFLASRGFNPDSIYKVINTCYSDNA